MAAIRIHNPNGSRKVANQLVAPIVAKNERVGMGNAQNVYFREDTAKPSQVLVAAADPDTLIRIADAKEALSQRTMNGVWRALGIGLIGLAVGLCTHVLRCQCSCSFNLGNVHPDRNGRECIPVWRDW